MRRFRPLAIAATVLATAAAPVAAQATVTTEMTRDEVITLRGTPLAERVTGDLTLLLYPGACAVRCATNDVVLLRQGRVIGAMIAEPAVAGDSAAPADSLDAEPSMRAAPGLLPAFVADEFSTLRAPEPLRVRPYRLPGSFTAAELADFDRGRAGAPRD